MLRPVGNFFKESYEGVYGECRSALTAIRTKGPSQLTFWVLALLIGVAATLLNLANVLGISWTRAVELGAAPFILGDLAKLAIAA